MAEYDIICILHQAGTVCLNLVSLFHWKRPPFYFLFSNLTIKHLFNYRSCSIIYKKALGNVSQAFSPKWAKGISIWAKCR